MWYLRSLANEALAPADNLRGPEAAAAALIYGCQLGPTSSRLRVAAACNDLSQMVLRFSRRTGPSLKTTVA